MGEVFIADVIGPVDFDIGITGDKPGIRLGAAPGGNGGSVDELRGR